MYELVVLLLLNDHIVLTLYCILIFMHLCNRQLHQQHINPSGYFSWWSCLSWVSSLIHMGIYYQPISKASNACSSMNSSYLSCGSDQPQFNECGIQLSYRATNVASQRVIGSRGIRVSSRHLLGIYTAYQRYPANAGSIRPRGYATSCISMHAASLYYHQHNNQLLCIYKSIKHSFMRCIIRLIYISLIEI